LLTQQADAESAPEEQLATDPEHVALVLKMEAPLSAPTRGEAARDAKSVRAKTAILVSCG
jgi:hypothetical protein